MADPYAALVARLETGELTEVEARLLVAELEEEWWLRRRATWRPYPWQVPPGRIETSGMFLILGGRGTGKTDGCARYITDHVHGPPCDPRVPGGHRLAIIAPTLGDAVESCVEGPSGLKAHDPRAVLRGGVGGTYVRWPSGAIAKLFGSHTKDDVDRLRSGGNRCVAAGTLISTERGPVPVEGVRVGERVWTRNGLRPVTHTHANGVRPLWRLETESGRTLYATGDHEIAVPGGWARLDVLEPGRTVLTWNYGLTLSADPTSSPGTACAGAGTRTVTTGTPTAACCTERSTSVRTDPSPTAGTSTTTTTTGSTTTRGTWSPNPRPSTGPNTATNADRTGTGSAAKRPGNARSTASTPASSAARRSPAGALTAPSCVRAGAANGGTAPTTPGVAMSGTCVSCAAANSSAASGPLRPRLAHDRVRRVTSLTSRPVAVYDLTVEADHEFIAGGVLVANCLVWFEELAAMRYLQEALDMADLGLRVGAHPHSVGSTTPKPRKPLRELIEKASTLVSSGRTAEATHLAAEVRANYLSRYGGTRLGLQELEGRLLEDVEGALWTIDTIAGSRVREAPELLRVVIAVDPAVSVTETSDETGLIAVGLGVDRHCYVLGDRSAKVAGTAAARRAWQMWQDYGGGHVVWEDNQGKKWVEDVLRQVWREMVAEGALPGGAPPLRGVTAKVGKRLRAEPVASLYELGMVHHVGARGFEELEEQLTTWVPESGESPDRLDALVHAVTDLAGKVRSPAEVGVPRGAMREALGRAAAVRALQGARASLPPNVRTRRGG